ncbi:MAG: hypothetical protein KAQ83_03445 [Nanoarchaeota archaeon]|nr:hypothetical protein [Nanoarchaeota archaeon]
MKYAPLSTSFFGISIIGFIVSVMYIPKLMGNSWAFAMGLVFLLMFFASFITMEKADPNDLK